MGWRLVLIGYFACIISGSILAQTISLEVLLETKEAAVGASVQLLDTNEDDLVDFAFADEKGRCSFTDVTANNYRLRIKFFGYRDTLISIAASPQRPLSLTISLVPIAYDLPGISVVDKIIGLRKEGDTLKYNLKAYLSGTEQTLGDILAGLPGLDVDAEGNVQVGNQKVDALLIEGKDIINDQHGLATGGLQAELIESVELIQNYRNQQELFADEKQTDKYAVNVLLKEGAKGKWSGNVQAYGGSRASWRADVNLFRTTEQQGWSLFLRQNNIGESPIDKPMAILLEDILKQNEFPIARVRMRAVTAGAGSPESLTGVQENNDYHFALSGDLDNQKGWKNKLYLTGTQANRNAAQSAQRLYFTEGAEENLATQEQVNFPFLYLRNRSSWRGKKQLTVLNIPLQFYNEERGNLQSGSFANSPFQQNQTSFSRQLKLAPELSHSIQLKHGLLIDVKQILDWERRNQEHVINSNESFLAFTDTSLTNYQFEQATSFESVASTTSAAVRKSWEKDLLQYEVSGSYLKEQTNNQSSNFYEAADNQLNTSTFQQGIKGVKMFGNRLRLIAILTHISIRQREEEHKKSPQQFWLPNALIYYEYQKLHALSVSLKQSIEIPGLIYSNQYNYVQNARLVNEQNLELGTLTQKAAYSLSWFKKPISGGHLYNFSLGYTQVKNDFISSATLVNNYIQTDLVAVPEVNRFSLTTFLALRYRKWSLQVNASANVEEGFASQQGQLVDLRRTIINWRCSLASVRWKKWQLKAGIRGLLNRQKIEQIATPFISVSANGSIDYTHQLWTFGVQIGQELQSSNAASSQLTLLNCDVAYRLSKRWKLFLDANNVLNLNRGVQVDARFTPNYEETISAQIFPGQVLGGVGYFF